MPDVRRARPRAARVRAVLLEALQAPRPLALARRGVPRAGRSRGRRRRERARRRGDALRSKHLAIGATMLFAACPEAPRAPPEREPAPLVVTGGSIRPPLEKATLDNGLTVYMLPVPS